MTSAWVVNCLIINLVMDIAGICCCVVGTAHLNGRRQGNLGLLLAVGLLVPVVPLLMAAVTLYWYNRQTAGITPDAQDVIDRCRAAAAEGYHTALVSPAVMDTLCQGFVPGGATRQVHCGGINLIEDRYQYYPRPDWVWMRPTDTPLTVDRQFTA